MTSPSIHLSDYVYEELLHQFKTNKYREGVRLPSENAFAQEFHVSRPVIREALERLRQDGFIVSKKGSGSYLVRMDNSVLHRPIRVQSFEQLVLCYEYRTNLEGIIAYQATMHATEQEKLRIENIYRKDCSKFSMGNEELMLSDFEFHLVIAQATHNPLYYQALEILTQQLSSGIELLTANATLKKDIYITDKDAEHAAIVRAIQTGNPRFAQAEMTRHLFSSLERIKALMKNNPAQ